MDSWADTDVEFDKLAAALSLPTVEALVSRRLAGQRHFDGSPKLRHVHVVAELAGRHARLLLAERDELERRYLLGVVRAAGLLHEDLMAGGSFEELVATADEATARAVAEISADMRQPWPKRIQTYANQVGLASPPAQAVKLADLEHDLHLLRPRLEAELAGPHFQELRCRISEMREAALALGHLHACLALRGRLNEVRAELRALELRCNKRRS